MLVASAALFPAVWTGGDWMRNARFLCPALPLLTSAAVASSFLLIQGAKSGGGGGEATGRLAGWSWQALAGLGVAVAGLFAVAGLGLVPADRLLAAVRGDRISAVAIQEGTMTEVSREVAEFLDLANARRELVAVNHAGALPYYSDLPTLDMTGLNDFHIAHNVDGRVHDKFDPDYVMERRPRFVVLNSRVRPGSELQHLPDGTVEPIWYTPGYWEGETALLRHPEFLENYRFIDRYWTWSWVTSDNYILLAERVTD